MAASASNGQRAGFAAYYALGILMLGVFLSFTDRLVLSLLIPAVRHDLGISDTQVSMLIGGVFAVFYVLMGLPFGWLADRTNRRNMLALAMGFWGIMTIAAGFTNSFLELGATRIGLAIGEAALMPAALSLIGDLFPASQRGRAVGAYTAAGVFGTGGSYLLGGLVLKAMAGVDIVTLPFLSAMPLWKAALVVVGVPTVLLGFLTLTMREAARAPSPAAGAFGPASGVPRLMPYVRANLTSFVCVYGNYIFVTLIAYGWLVWLPIFFVRRYGMAPSAAGISVGLVTLTTGVAGSLIGGAIGDHWTARGALGGRFRLNMVLWIGATFACLGMLIDNVTVSLACAGLYFFVDYVAYGAYGAVIQDMTPPVLRGRAVVLWYVITGLIGIGLGPITISLATEYLFGGDAGLAKAMVFVPLPSIAIGAFLCWRGLRPFDATRKALLAPLPATTGPGLGIGRARA